MTLTIELSTTWRLWPILTWEWSYYGSMPCTCCDFYALRSITVMLALPFATLALRPGIGFKTRAAVEGCPNQKRREATAASTF